MFDLNDAVATWRRDLARTTHLPRPALDELESHFLDDIDIQMDGVDAERAYLMAIERLGEPNALQREFEKNDQGKRWLFAGARLGLAGYIFHNVVFAVDRFWLGIVAMLGPEERPAAEGFAAVLQALSIALDEVVLAMLVAGELLLMLPIALIGLWTTYRRRQKGWSLTFLLTLIAVPLMLNDLNNTVFSLGSISLFVLLITSIFTVYPPSLPDAIENRLRRA
ncbi:MAG: hypothetical protein RhofKO_08370 [Rhodothermales bacterium]